MSVVLPSINHNEFRYRVVERYLYTDDQLNRLQTITYNTIHFMLYGELTITWDGYENVKVGAGELFFLPRGANISASIVGERVEYVAVRLVHDLDNTPAFMNLVKSESCEVSNSRPFPSMPIKGVLLDFIRSVKRYAVDGIITRQLQNVKLIELYNIFTNYYTTEECKSIFHPILHKKLSFRTFILDNYSLSVTIDELADKANMSRSTFDRNFKEAFGMTPYKWIDCQMRMLIMRKVAEPNVTVKDVMYEAGMSNPSQFTQLCRRLMGISPSELIRNKRY